MDACRLPESLPSSDEQREISDCADAGHTEKHDSNTPLCAARQELLLTRIGSRFRLYGDKPSELTHVACRSSS
jgi:hypothetical protein